MATLYLRFFHLELHHLRFFQLEALVTVGVLILFLSLPLRSIGLAWRFRRFARNRTRACVTVFLFSLGGRLALLPIEPFPPPGIHDEFSYLLASDTFAHGRLTNPTPPQWRHFEQFYVLMQPTFASKYGAAQPLFMAAGQRWLGTPRAGVLLSMALAAASLCWMLQAYLPAQWAFLGGLLAVVRMSWFSYFGNSYWGGSVAVLGGCLVMGAAPRLVRKRHARDSLLLALGLLLLANARPFEGAMLSLPVCLWTGCALWRAGGGTRAWLPGGLLLLCGACLTGYYFYRVTGRLMFPWVAYWQRWTLCPPFFFAKPNLGIRYEFADQLHYFRDAEMRPYLEVRTLRGLIIDVLVKVISQWIFFVFPALTLPLIGLAPTIRAKRSRVLMGSLAVASLGFLTETWLQAHYVAVATGAIYLVIVNGLRRMYVAGRWNPLWSKALQGTLAAVLVMLLVRLAVVPTNTWVANWGSRTPDIPGYQAIVSLMDAKPGRHLVLVRYQPDHFWGYSWINNGYDFAARKVVWARDTEPAESNRPLLCAFKDRQVWRVTPPEADYLPAPDRTATWDPRRAERFLEPYLQTCDGR